MEGRGGQEEEAGIEIAFLDLLNALYRLRDQYQHWSRSRDAGMMKRRGGVRTSISISSTQTRPFSAMSFTALTLVP